MLSKSGKFLLCVVVSMLFAMSAWGQTGNQASLEGTVTDASGALVPNAAVKLTNTETGVTLMTSSDASGYFKFPVIPVGTYDLNVEQPGFGPYNAKGIDVAVGANGRCSPDSRTT